MEPSSTWIPKEEDGCGSASHDHDHCRGYESEVKKSNRGGVCVHKRAHGDEIHGYLTCCHKFLTGQRRRKEPEGPDETWKQSVVQMYGAARQQRRRKKRKLFDQHNNDYPWGRPHTNEDEDKDSLSNSNGSNHHLRENESSMLAYLQTRHNGDVASSNRSLRVALTGGRGKVIIPAKFLGFLFSHLFLTQPSKQGRFIRRTYTTPDSREVRRNRPLHGG